ncbi:uncharacterized protein LOC106880973 [Octopus bimaculoides]|uniref:Uncharacterized protein n=1 Tax=Octopus bimaculoides TaxID=37653 RepID=A0A0L8FUZ9_OCTBM|nr:uncharacterized protein LOC106880973 [Octopus bimaculoides]|eukprot:XP_014786641.1 PREDICTED: uncharacterized protein LOC106880973 [Octopus bimaculoides]
MFCHLFRRQRNVEKVSRELPPIPKEVKLCPPNSDNDLDDSNHIYEEIADMGQRTSENVQKKLSKVKQNDASKNKDSQTFKNFLPQCSPKTNLKTIRGQKENHEIEYKEIEFCVPSQSEVNESSSKNLHYGKYSKEQAPTKNTETHVNLQGCCCKECYSTYKCNLETPDLFSNLNGKRDDKFNSLNSRYCKSSQKVTAFDYCKCEKQFKNQCKCDLKELKQQKDRETSSNELAFVDLLEHEEMDGNDSWCEYHMNTAQGYSASSMLSDNLSLNNVKEEQRQDPHIVQINNHKSCKGAKLCECEENSDCVSLTSVSSLPYNCSLSTYISYNDSSCNRVKSISDMSSVNSSTFSSLCINDVASRKTNIFSNNYCHRRSRTLPEIATKGQKEFKMFDINIANEVVSKNSSKLPKQSIVSSPFEYNGKVRKNQILNELIYLNYEQLQLKCL